MPSRRIVHCHPSGIVPRVVDIIGTLENLRQPHGNGESVDLRRVQAVDVVGHLFEEDLPGLFFKVNDAILEGARVPGNL